MEETFEHTGDLKVSIGSNGSSDSVLYQSNKEKCDCNCHNGQVGGGCGNCDSKHRTINNIPLSEERNEQIKDFVNELAFELKPSNDTMEAIRLFRKKLPSFLDQELSKREEEGRLSVLRDFDSVCKADAFMGFSDIEWQAVKKFFEINKQISKWDK